MNQPTKQTLIDLLFVFVVALLPQLPESVYFFFTSNLLLTDTSNIYLQCALLLPSFAIVWYVMRVRGQRPADIGIYEDRYDPLSGVMLALLCMFVYSFFRTVVNSIWPNAPTPKTANSFFKGYPLPGLVLYAVLTAAREELVIRGFMMRSFFLLTGNRVATVLAATCIDFLLFLPYGALPALGVAVGQLVLSVYFVRTGKLMPVMLAHIVLNVVFVWLV